MVMATRAAYQRLVNDRPAALTLRRVTMEDDGAGGISETIEEIPVTVRLSIPARRDPVITDAGLLVKQSVALMATWNTDIAAGDRFEYGGQMYEIVALAPDAIRGDVLGYQGEAEAVPA